MARVASWILVLLSMGLVLWVRLLPLSLPAVDGWTVGPEASQDIRSQLQYEGADGGQYVYLGDFDSYHWLRMARNMVRSGSSCDVIVDGECRDTYGNAPVGSHMSYIHSAHVGAIAILHRLITFFRPDYPLPASAYLVPVILGVAGVLPAFLIARRLSGDAGGLSAAVLVSLNPVFLMRSIGGDNDVWNVVLPLFMMWAVIGALVTGSRRRKLAYAGLSIAIAALHAATWRGWVFAYAVLLLGVVGLLGIEAVRHVVHQRNPRVWRSAPLQGLALVAGPLCLAAACFALLAASGSSYPEMSYRTLTIMAKGFVGAPAAGPEEAGLWPNVLDTVMEAGRPDFATVVETMGGRILFIAALFGLLLLLLPSERWDRRHLALMAGAAVLYGAVISSNPQDAHSAVALLAIPLAGALLLYLSDGRAPDRDHLWAGVIVAIWFFGALYFCYEGQRFIMLLGPPFGIAVAVTVGRLYQWLKAAAATALPRFSKPASALVAALVALVMTEPVMRGYSVARGYVPEIDDAWWNTLAAIRENSDSDAIVNTWWDYGYWAKYVAERRVVNAGGSLLSHVPHWVGRALVTPRERESVGILRMLDCGSDATPLPEGRYGAYGKIRALGRGEIEAYLLVAELAGLDRRDAETHLKRNGFSPEERSDILASTHCMPPEAYLVVSSEQLHARYSWMHLGAWDLRRAYVAFAAPHLPEIDAPALLASRLGYGNDEAVALYEAARKLTSRRERNRFVSPFRGYLRAGWRPCYAMDAAERMSCPISLWLERAGIALDRFVFDAASVKRSGFRAASGEGSAGTAAPGTLVVAGADRLQVVEVPAPAFPEVGVLVDVPNGRILIASPAHVGSTLVHLVYLDGRYSNYYEKVAEHTTHRGERVSAWKINWRGPRGLSRAPVTGSNASREHVSALGRRAGGLR